MFPFIILFIVGFLLILPQQAFAIPAFARQYKVSCNTCHAAFPKLNSYGEQFASDNYRMPNWRDTVVDTGDEMLALPKYVPLSIRAMAYAQAREGKYIDPVSGETEKADTDFQAPYMIKVLSSAPLSDRISFYFYGILAEKGENGTVIIEDAWFSYSSIFDTGIDLMIGQFQISDLMFPRELRLTFQDYMIYRMAGITYDRGVVFSKGFDSVSLDFGLVNGNGIEENLKINSPGYKRPDHMFDNDRKKTAFGRIGFEVAGVSTGLFGLYGKHKTKETTAAGTDSGNKYADKKIFGIDISGNVEEKVYYFFQYLYNDWGKYFDDTPDKTYRWWGIFAGIDYIYSDKVVLSVLYNYADAGDFDGTSTIYEGININTLTVTYSYYFMRNVKGIIEATYDFQSKDNDSDYVGHETKEGYILIGFDTAF
ncbi:hypothetical protein [Persephonella sp.]